MASVTIRLARCTVRETFDGVADVLCWGTVALDWDDDVVPPIMPCGHDGAHAEIREAEGTYNADQPCDPACTSATGAFCICSCGGRNHGITWLIGAELGFRRGPGHSIEWDGRPWDPAHAEAVRARWRKWTAEQSRSRAIRAIVSRHVAAAQAAQTRREAKAAAAGQELLSRRDAWNLTPGQTAAAPRAIEREKREAAERAERAAAAAASDFVGEIGERLDVEAMVTFTHRIERDPHDRGFGGDKVLVGLVDDAGNILKTFATGGWAWKASKGDRVHLRATVRRHETYDGERQTVLTRCTDAVEA